MNFKEIDEARRLLGLGETATLKEIKAAYRRLAHTHHPDKHAGNGADMETMKQLNRANKVLIEYCDFYKYSFKQEDVAGVYPEEEDEKKWRDNWSF